MGYVMFFLAAVAACLLWSAAFTAAAARTEQTWLRWLLAAVAVATPLVALLPFVLLTGLLEIGMTRPLAIRWFPPTLTAFLSVAIGGAWIVAAGLSAERFTGDRVAARWPVVGLAGLFVAAKLVTGGIVLILENAVAAQAPYLRIEAAQLMQANLPPVVPAAENAATLYAQAFAALDADPATKDPKGPLASADVDPSPEAAVELLVRQANAIDMLRRAADRDVCRFTRDWTRPSFDMILPEVTSARRAARLLALSARSRAAVGDTEAALRDVATIHRMARHVGSEPLLISTLVGNAIDTTALETLCAILPRLAQADLPLLDRPDLRDLLDEMPSLRAASFGEEAFGLALFANIADSTDITSLVELFGATGDSRPNNPTAIPPRDLLYRGFLLPSDIAGYRDVMHRYQQLAAEDSPYADVKKRADAIEASFEERNPGPLASMIAPALSGVFRAQVQAEARKLVATAVVAATRDRLEKGSLPEILPSMPRDPFAADKTLAWKRTDDRLTVYSVGPDGEDDGGPVRPGEDAPEGNDDVGLSIAL